MENQRLPEIENNMDVKALKTSTSRFYFYLSLAGYLIFFLTACYSLWTHRYQDNIYKEVKVQESSLYNPVYK